MCVRDMCHFARERERERARRGERQGERGMVLRVQDLMVWFSGEG